jgi:hypothetical protein
MESRRYPIGHYAEEPEPTVLSRSQHIQDILNLVPNLRNTIQQLDAGWENTTYRPGGWTVKQIIHHLADNDMNAYLRFKRALTENNPQASSYREDLWGELHDYKELPIEHSLLLLELLHYRFHVLLKGMQPADFQRSLVTGALGSIHLDTALQRFIWHHRHHLAQIHLLMVREV